MKIKTKSKTSHYFKATLVTATFATLLPNIANADDHGWFLRPNIGLSTLSDQTADSSGVLGATGQADINVDSGFVAGLGVGYRYNSNLAIELAWEYRTNDSSVILDNGVSVEESNYASNTFFLNAIYNFDSSNSWQPYVGAGLSWIQEVDIDLEVAGIESSFSSEGDLGFQVFAGIGYELNDHWQLQAELRYGSIGDIDLEAELNTLGSFSGADYDPTTVQLGLVYSF
ncbi:MAG: porin family protein [Acidiferrobacterales bacterium]|nr:porin family protein [Acidiferrobacterales bacterium]